VFLTI